MTSFESWIVGNVSWLLPLFLLVVNIAFKVLVDHKATLPDLFQALIHLPVEMKFLALGFFGGFALAPQGDVNLGFIFVLFFLFTSMFTVTFAKRATTAFQSADYKTCITLFALNFCFSFLALSYSVSKLQGMAQ